MIEVAGTSGPRSYQLTRKDIRAIRAPVVFASAGFDGYGGDLAAREWYRWARPPKRLELVPGFDHGTDLLRRDNPLHEQVMTLIARFVEQVLVRAAR